MIALRHTLPLSMPGTEHHIVSWQFGKPGARPKAYLQAGLHADEWPPMLIMHHLKRLLIQLEADGALNGEIIAVPSANPIGLAQIVHGVPFGRFNLADGRNFNRGYPALGAAVDEIVARQLTADADGNVASIRVAMRQALAAETVTDEAQALKQWLMSQACDADIVLDLHCDNEALMHVYAGTDHPRVGMSLAMLTGALALLTATESGDHPFDEAVAASWAHLARRYTARFPIPCACFSATIEFRGQTDLSHELASGDAMHLIQFLSLQGLLTLTPFELPAPLCEATPLDAVETITAPHAGLVVPVQPLGSRAQPGEIVAELIDPITGRVTVLVAHRPGLLFARTSQRYVAAGCRVAKLAGVTSFQKGNLLGP
jgi:predicted deacylase